MKKFLGLLVATSFALVSCEEGNSEDKYRVIELQEKNHKLSQENEKLERDSKERIETLILQLDEAEKRATHEQERLAKSDERMAQINKKLNDLEGVNAEVDSLEAKFGEYLSQHEQAEARISKLLLKGKKRLLELKTVEPQLEGIGPTSVDQFVHLVEQIEKVASENDDLRKQLDEKK